MAKNEILPFGIGANANVLTPAKYEALAARIGGFSSGVAASEQLNTVWRQSTFIASVLAQFIANRSNKDVLDDGGAAALLTNLELAIKTYANSNLPAASTTVAGIAKLSSETNSSSEALAATPKAVKTVSDAALKSSNNLSEIKAAGTAAMAAAIDNLGISANLIPVGTPIPWPTATPPIGWLKCNGNSFSATTYPKLALAYPSGVLPDLRGEFIRGWDDGRGADAARTLLSAQSDAIRNITAGTNTAPYKGWLANGQLAVGDGAGALSVTSVGTQVYSAISTPSTSLPVNWFYWNFDSSRVVPTAAENRPRNIAFNYIVRAA
ncbi:phage tail protein [Yersinia kristensenii]|uniref:phage tail protein n=1 Tax=Yersinia kristensenii TaxID=28152 RepID=UPI0005E5C3F5|nr:phage tail protein [Yersinia kristensenii]CFR19435.1 putative bacteriophage tail fiber protein [Yersinia kristensenii]